MFFRRIETKKSRISEHFRLISIRATKSVSPYSIYAQPK